jgi:hypothetical protein
MKGRKLTLVACRPDGAGSTRRLRRRRAVLTRSQEAGRRAARRAGAGEQPGKFAARDRRYPDAPAARSAALRHRFRRRRHRRLQDTVPAAQADTDADGIPTADPVPRCTDACIDPCTKTPTEMGS